jgi:hypothetical protein
VIVTYSPAGRDQQVWTWNPNQVASKVAEVIEERYGRGTWDEFNLHLMQGSMRARRVLLWHFLRSERPVMFEDVDFAASELTIDLEPPELHALRDGVESAAGLTEENRQAALDMLDRQIAEAGGAGKANSAPNAKSTA